MSKLKQLFSRIATELHLRWLVLVLAVACTQAKSPTPQELVNATLTISDVAVASALTAADPDLATLEKVWEPRKRAVQAAFDAAEDAKALCACLPQLAKAVEGVHCTKCSAAIAELKEALCR